MDAAVKWAAGIGVVLVGHGRPQKAAQLARHGDVGDRGALAMGWRLIGSGHEVDPGGYDETMWLWELISEGAKSGEPSA